MSISPFDPIGHQRTTSSCFGPGSLILAAIEKRLTKQQNLPSHSLRLVGRDVLRSVYGREQKGPDGTARCPGFAPRERAVTFDPALTRPRRVRARIESAALDVCRAASEVFNKDFLSRLCEPVFRDLRFLPERLCVPGTDLRTSSATSRARRLWRRRGRRTGEGSHGSFGLNPWKKSGVAQWQSWCWWLRRASMRYQR